MIKHCLKPIRILFSHFQARLLLAFLTCTLIPLSVIGCVSYGVSYSIARDKIMDSAILAADQLHVQLNSRIRQAENVADTLDYDLYVLEHTDKQELSACLDALNSLRNNLSLYKSTFDFYHICVFFKDKTLGSEEGLFFYPLSSMESFGLCREETARPGSSSRWTLSPQLMLPFVLNPNQTKTDVVMCVRVMSNQKSGQLQYASCIMMDTGEFSQLLSSSFSNTEITSWLLTPEGITAASSSPELKAEAISAQKEAYYEEGQACYYVLSLDNGWRQVTKIPKSYIAGGIKVLLRSIFLTLLLSVPFTVVTALFISKNLSRRIRLLSKSMENFRLIQTPAVPKPLSVPRPEEPQFYDEIDALGLTFEQMQETLQKNVSSILELSLTEERLKYQLLQSQINPHFLYNILGSIKTCQSLGKLETAGQMITDLTRFYRLTLRKSGELITIRDELEIAGLYLNMEKLCHTHELSWRIDLEDGIENFMICKFTLQPFLENSILHGISEQTPDLFIEISGSYGEDTVIMKIEDNGAGITEEKLQELRTSLENKTVTYEKHFGICNVNARISSQLYGNGSIKIESGPGIGTSVTIEFLQIEGI